MRSVDVPQDVLDYQTGRHTGFRKYIDEAERARREAAEKAERLRLEQEAEAERARLEKERAEYEAKVAREKLASEELYFIEQWNYVPWIAAGVVGVLALGIAGYNFAGREHPINVVIFSAMCGFLPGGLVFGIAQHITECFARTAWENKQRDPNDLYFAERDRSRADRFGNPWVFAFYYFLLTGLLVAVLALTKYATSDSFALWQAVVGIIVCTPAFAPITVPMMMVIGAFVLRLHWLTRHGEWVELPYDGDSPTDLADWMKKHGTFTRKPKN